MKKVLRRINFFSAYRISAPLFAFKWKFSFIIPSVHRLSRRYLGAQLFG